MAGFSALAPAYDSNLKGVCTVAGPCGLRWMTTEKIASLWLEHRHVNCFQLMTLFRLKCIKWITVRLLIYSSEAGDTFGRAARRGGGVFLFFPLQDENIKAVKGIL